MLSVAQTTQWRVVGSTVNEELEVMDKSVVACLKVIPRYTNMLGGEAEDNENRQSREPRFEPSNYRISYLSRSLHGKGKVK